MTLTFMTFSSNIILKFGIERNMQSTYEIGDRIGQILILPYPIINFEEVEELSKTDRGVDGFGSTGER